MKKIIYWFQLTVVFLFGFKYAKAQFIINGGFEQGPTVTNFGQIDYATGWERSCSRQRKWENGQMTLIQGTPDLADRFSTAPAKKVPHQGVESRNSGNNRFAFMIGAQNGHHREQNIYGEAIIGSFSQPLNSYKNYHFEFYVANKQFYYGTGGTCYVEVVLRKSSDLCGDGKIVYLSDLIPLETFVPAATSEWHHQAFDFTLTELEDNIYDRFEVRIIHEDPSTYPQINVDDFSLDFTQLPEANFNFVGFERKDTVPSIYGPMEVNVFCNRPIAIDGSASNNETHYNLEVAKFDLVTWQDIDVLFSDWVGTGTVPSFFDLESLPNVNFEQSLPTGQVYRVRLAVGPVWDQEHHFMRFDICANIPPLFSFIISPNPSPDLVTISPSNENQAGSFDIKLVDLYGNEQIFKKANFDETKSVQLNVVDLKKGFYVINIIDPMGNIFNYKFQKL